jgi:hypothetical protein
MELIDRKSPEALKTALEIQERAKKKDTNFCLSGKWKTFVREYNGFKVYAVDGEWLRNNISIHFGAGGHGLVHEFIPLNEIWVSTHHFIGCGCSNLKEAEQPVSENYFDSTVIHEIAEFMQMEKGMPFWKAHEIALEVERKIDLLKDPHTEVD